MFKKKDLKICVNGNCFPNSNINFNTFNNDFKTISESLALNKIH